MDISWIINKKKETRVEIQKIEFSEMDKWYFESLSKNIVHKTGKFFSVVGLDIHTNWGLVTNWSQPIIKQPEIGILGIITKEIGDELYFLI